MDDLVKEQPNVLKEKRKAILEKREIFKQLYPNSNAAWRSFIHRAREQHGVMVDESKHFIDYNFFAQPLIHFDTYCRFQNFDSEEEGDLNKIISGLPKKHPALSQDVAIDKDQDGNSSECSGPKIKRSTMGTYHPLVASSDSYTTRDKKCIAR